MDAKILIVALLAFSLVLFGCAKGGTASAPGGVASGIQGAGAPSSVPPSGEVAPAETQTSAEGNGSEPDLGGLFNIDTVQPDSGSGYEVPAAGE